MSGSGSSVGGLVGANNASSIISTSYSTGSVSGTDNVGGLVGYNNESSIQNSYSTGNVIRLSGTSTAFGAFIGYNHDDGSGSSLIQYCYSIGSVFYSGAPSPSDKGFVGAYTGNPAILSNYFDKDISGHTSGYLATAKTTAQMKSQATFTGWIFTPTTGIWNIQSGKYISYPYLQAFTYDAPGAIMQVNPIPGLEIAPVISTPSTQASDIQFSNITRTGMTVRWSKTDGDGSLLLAKEQYRIASSPLTDAVVYNGASTVYTSAPSVGGAKMLYNGTDANPSISVTGLTRYKLYYFRAFAYNNELSPYYLQTNGVNNPRSRWTLRRDGMMEEDLTLDAEYAYPNPASNSISTTLDMFEAGIVSAKLYDAAGRVAAELFNQSLPFGTHELKFDISNVPSGVYQLIISKGSEAIVYPVSVVR